MLRRAVILGVLLLGVARADEGHAYLERPVDLVCTERDVATIASELGVKAGFAIEVAPAVKARLSLSLSGVTWRKAFEAVVEKAQLRARRIPGGLRLEEAAPARVTLQRQGMSLREAIVAIVRAGGMGVVLAPTVQGTVNVDVRDEPWPRALKKLLEPWELHAVVRGSVLLVSPATGEAELPDEGVVPFEWPSRTAEEARTIDATVEGASLRDLVDEVGRRVSRPILCAPGVDATVTVSFRRRSWRDVLEVLASQTHAELREEGGVIELVSREELDVNADDDARSLLRMLCSVAGKSHVMGRGVGGSVLVDLHGALFRDAIGAIASACGVEISRLRGNVLTFTADQRPPLVEKKTRLEGGTKLDLAVEDAALRDVLEVLSTRAEVPIALASGIEEKLTLSLRSTPSFSAVECIAAATRCSIESLPGGALLLDQPPLVTVSFTDADVRTVFQLVAAYSGKNVIIAPDVAGAVDVDFHDTHWLLGLRAIARAAGLHLTRLDTGVVLGSAAAVGPELVREARDDSWRAGLPSRSVAVVASDTPIVDVVDPIARAAGLTAIVEPDVHANVTLGLPRVDALDALAVVARVAGCDIARRGAIVVFTKRPPLTFQATNVAARDWFELLSKALNAPVTVAPGLEGRLTFDCHDLSFADSLRASAASLGWIATPAPEGGFRVAAGPRPFVPALRSEPRAPRPKEDSAKKDLAKLEKKLDGIFARVESAADDIEKLPEVFQDLNETLSEYRLSAAFDLADKKFAAWRGKTRARREVSLAIELQLFVGRGNEQLRAMLRAKQAERWDEVQTRYRAVRDLVARMRREERDEFHRNAEAIFIRAKMLADESTKLADFVKHFPVRVQAIQIDPRPEGKNRAVLFLGAPRVYEEGQNVRDADGAETPVRVAKISEGSVKLAFEDVQLVRELDPD